VPVAIPSWCLPRPQVDRGLACRVESQTTIVPGGEHNALPVQAWQRRHLPRAQVVLQGRRARLECEVERVPGERAGAKSTFSSVSPSGRGHVQRARLRRLDVSEHLRVVGAHHDDEEVTTAAAVEVVTGGGGRSNGRVAGGVPAQEGAAMSGVERAPAAKEEALRGCGAEGGGGKKRVPAPALARKPSIGSSEPPRGGGGRGSGGGTAGP
jgi:hypothetical protein